MLALDATRRAAAGSGHFSVDLRGARPELLRLGWGSLQSEGVAVRLVVAK